MSSKTRREMEGYLDLLGCDLGSFENGAALLLGSTEVPLPGALGVGRLRQVRDGLARRLGLSLPSLDELSDEEARRLTSLQGGALAAARARRFSLPLVAAPGDDARLRAALDEPGLALTRGGTFLHLTGVHDKSGAVHELLSRGLLSRPLLAFGDAPNDAGMLRLADVAVIVPRQEGPDPELVAALPHARLAPHSGCAPRRSSPELGRLSRTRARRRGRAT
jgi:mannosyl-3-phosphoglycerate phosphatase